jgi:hypothetical protein
MFVNDPAEVGAVQPITTFNTTGEVAVICKVILKVPPGPEGKLLAATVKVLLTTEVQFMSPGTVSVKIITVGLVPDTA